jgi:hypothetical protein
MNEELAQFRSEDLLAIARNQSAQMRHEAIRILVERGSEHCGHPDISHEAASIVHSDPQVLKLADPSVHAAGRLPGVLDVLARSIDRIGILEDIGKVTREDIAALLAKIQEQRRNTIELESQLRTALAETDRRLTEQIVSSYQRLALLTDEAFARTDKRLRLLERSWWQRIKDWWKG